MKKSRTFQEAWKCCVKLALGYHYYLSGLHLLQLPATEHHHPLASTNYMAW